MSSLSGPPLLQALAGAISARSLYPAGHPRVVRSIGLLHDAVRRAAATTDEPVNILSIGEDLVLLGRPERGDTLYQEQLRRALRRVGVQSLTFSPMVTEAELEALVAGLTRVAILEPSAGVSLGKVQLAFGDEEAGGGDAAGQRGSTARGLAEHHLDAASGALQRFVAGGARELEQLDGVIWQLMEATARSARVLLLLAPLEERQDALFRHAVHVCLLTLAHARALGIEGPVQHELGVAALLHDIGKQELPEPGSGATTDPDRHPELGAARLCGIEGIPPLTVIVAFEHHLRWDGAPGFPRSARRPGFAAQLVAVANAWEHLLARAPLAPPAVQRAGAAAALRQQAGGALDPVLVESFLGRFASGVTG